MICFCSKVGAPGFFLVLVMVFLAAMTGLSELLPLKDAEAAASASTRFESPEYSSLFHDCGNCSLGEALVDEGSDPECTDLTTTYETSNGGDCKVQGAGCTTDNPCYFAVTVEASSKTGCSGQTYCLKLACADVGQENWAYVPGGVSGQDEVCHVDDFEAFEDANVSCGRKCVFVLLKDGDYVAGIGIQCRDCPVIPGGGQ